MSVFITIIREQEWTQIAIFIAHLSVPFRNNTKDNLLPQLCFTPWLTLPK